MCNLSRSPTSRDARRRRRLTPAVGSLLVGAATTALVLAAYSLGWLQRIDHLGYDTFFRTLGSIEADPRILMVDIDDSTLRRVGRWPWDRRKLAGLIDVLSDLGATHIVLDLTFTSPQQVRTELTPGLRSAARASEPRAPTQAESLGLLIHDDEELAAAMARAGNVYLGVDFEFHFPTAQHVDAEPRDPNPYPSRNPRIMSACMYLECDFRLTEAEVRQRVYWPDDAPFPFAEVKAWAAREICRLFREARPDGNVDELSQRVLPELAPNASSPDVEDLRLAFEAVSVEGRIQIPRGVESPQLTGHVMSGTIHRPPMGMLARAAKGAGSVAVQTSVSDPTVRSLPLATTVATGVIPHLSFLVAGDVTRLTTNGLSVRGSWLTTDRHAASPREAGIPGERRLGDNFLPDRRFNFQIPIETSGTTLIPWAAPARPGPVAWEATFRHMPASRLMQLVDRLDAIRANQLWRQQMVSEAVRWASRSTLDTWDWYANLIQERNDALSAVRCTVRTEDRDQLLSRVSNINAEVAEVEQRALFLLDALRTACAEEVRSGRPPKEWGEVALFEQALAPQSVLYQERTQASLCEEVEKLRKELREEIADSVCLVGLVATSVADFVPTPIDEHCPGVAVHAHMLNALLRDRFVHAISQRPNVIVLALLGQLAAIAASRWRLRQSLLFIAIAGAVMVTICAILFLRDLTVVSWAPGLFMLGAVWVAVIAYRQTTEERQRRRVTRMLAQYTSPAVAAGIAAHLDDRGFAPQRRIITCFFSDLGDFTAAAERLDPEDTRRLLQPYLEHVSTALIAEQALVNKFIGDGVFAFFNAPLLPCTAQAARACRAALACLRATAASNAPNSPNPPLPVRIGIATGEAIVGDFGTDRKRDYTSIGDTVNVASRLEAANKTLGTSILVSESARQAAGDGFAFRPVGLLRVAGRVQAVKAFELLGGGLSLDASPASSGGMETALEHFSSRRWPQARATFEELLSVNANDGAARFYLRAIERFKAVPPPDDWQGEVETGGK